MIHIFKYTEGRYRGQFDTTEPSTNGRKLRNSRQGYSRRAGVYKMIRSTLKNYGNDHAGSATWALVQDDTGKDPVVMKVYRDKIIQLYDVKPEKKYIPPAPRRK